MQSVIGTVFVQNFMGLLMMLLIGPVSLVGQGKQGETRPGWSHLKYALYFTYPEIEKLLLDTASMRETMEYLGPVRPEGVYLECTTRGDVNVTQM